MRVQMAISVISKEDTLAASFKDSILGGVGNGNDSTDGIPMFFIDNT